MKWWNPPPDLSLLRVLTRISSVLLSASLSFTLSAQHALSSSQPIEQMWAEASAAQQGHQYARAADLYQKILAEQPDLTEARVNLGIMLHLEGKLQQAVATFDEVVSKHPDLLGPSLIAGLDELKLDHPQAALPHLQRALQLSPGNIEARVGLANSYLQLKNYEEALGQFNRATELNAGYAEAWYGLGATYLSMEKQAELDLQPSASPYRSVLLGESLLDQGQLEKGTSLLSSAAVKSPAVPCARSILGFAYLRQSKLTQAAQQFAMDWNERTGRGCLLAKLGTASLHEKRDDTLNAMREVREAAAIDPAFVAVYAGSYVSDLDKGGANSPLAEILATQHAVQVPSASPEVNANEGHYSACASQLIRNSGHLAVAKLHTLCFCSFYTGQDEIVMTASKKILKQSPADPEALYWRTRSAERLGLAAITRASRLDPDSVSLHTLMGDLLQTKGDLAASEAEYRKAIAIKPTFLAAHLGLARTLNSDRKSDEAERELRIVLGLSPNDAEANYLMGEILVNRDALRDALPFLLKALHAAPEDLPYVHADLGAVYEQQGETEKAIAEMKEAVSVDVDGSFYYRLGRLYLKAGNRESGEDALAMAAKLKRATDAAAQFVK